MCKIHSSVKIEVIGWYRCTGGRPGPMTDRTAYESNGGSLADTGFSVVSNHSLIASRQCNTQPMITSMLLHR